MAERWSFTTRPDRRSDLQVCLISWILFVTSVSETDVSVDILFSDTFFHNISQQERRQKAATQSYDLVLIRCNTEGPIKLWRLRVCVWLKFCHKILPIHIKNSADTKQGGKWSSWVLQGGEVARFTLGMLQSNKFNVITHVELRMYDCCNADFMFKFISTVSSLIQNFKKVLPDC